MRQGAGVLFLPHQVGEEGTRSGRHSRMRTERRPPQLRLTSALARRAGTGHQCRVTTTIAITGATGFVGRHLAERAVAQGNAVRALTRQPQPAQPGIVWIEGAPDLPGSLGRLDRKGAGWGKRG